MTAGSRRETALWTASKTGDSKAIGDLAPTGEELAARDAAGWTALDWAAGHGDAATVRALLAAGADPLATGEDERPPYEIALAAGHREAARILRERVRQSTGEDPSSSWMPYCRAYPLAALRAYPDWPAGAAQRPDGAPLPGDTLVYLHHDLTVTSGIWPGEDIVFDARTPRWERFCRQELGFAVPDDLDLITETTTGSNHG
ncbi:ankyrin repeat domain-containing protein [Streptomyces sp. NPDC056149]|uniref:ankyrin repeat domain-containing protein n=1 Tax=Streptomyces sp. NPDC056149 TaxID=3345728 RepID=UPI0035DC8167